MQFENERERSLMSSVISCMNSVPISGLISEVRGFMSDLSEVESMIANATIAGQIRDTSGEEEMLASR